MPHTFILRTMRILATTVLSLTLMLGGPIALMLAYDPAFNVDKQEECTGVYCEQ